MMATNHSDGQGPGIDFKRPSSESSPTRTRSATAARGMRSSATRMPTAMARSSPAPSFLMLAGARLTVIFLTGNWKPLFLRAARTRSRLSRTVASGNPTMENCGNPDERSTSTSTRWASMPTIAALNTLASTITSTDQAHRSSDRE